MFFCIKSQNTTKCIADSINHLYDFKIYYEWDARLDAVSNNFNSNGYILEKDKNKFDKIVEDLDQVLKYCEAQGNQYSVAKFRAVKLVNKSKEICELLKTNVKSAVPSKKFARDLRYCL